MAQNEIYLPAKSIPIEGFTHPEIQGVTVPVEGHPFKDGHIAQFSVAAIEKPNNELNGRLPVLRRISDHHGRSYEFIVGEESSILWADIHGNIFTAINTKGNNCEAVEVCRHEVTPSGFTYYGLQDSDSMVRVLRGSEMLRVNGIETETIIKVIEPAQFPYNGELLSPADYKKKLVEAVWEKDAKNDEKSILIDLNLATRDDIPKLSVALDKTVFFITIRGVQVNERLADFAHAKGPAEKATMLRKAFRYVNLAEKQAARKDSDYTPQFFSADNPQDIERYFRDYLPKKIAKNLAGIHNLDLVHYFPHSSNISLVGSFYDLDSLKGEPLQLGDKEITYTDIKDDLRKCMEALSNLDLYPELGQVDQRVVRERKAIIKRNFAESYIKAVGWDKDVIENFEGIASLYGYFIEPEFDERANYYITRVFEQLELSDQVNSFALLELIDQEINLWDKEIKEVIGYQDLQEVFQHLLEAFVAGKIRTQYREMNQDEVYNESVNHSSRIFASKEATRVMRIMKTTLGEKYSQRDEEKEIPEETSSAFINNTLNLYKKFVKNWRWEEDVIIYSLEINFLFDEFSLRGQFLHPFMAYYRELLTKQLGWDFVFEGNLDQLIVEFHEADQELARWSVEQMLENMHGESLSDQEREVIIEIALRRSSPFGVNFAEDHNARYNNFILEEINEQFSNQVGSNLLKIGDKYGYAIEYVVNHWLVKRYEDMFINDISDQMEEEIEKVGEARIQQLREAFISQFD